tara:strand:+ start:104 stop:466 length:363 start_codon:yes stop_codon:yes gene_type:complete
LEEDKKQQSKDVLDIDLPIVGASIYPSEALSLGTYVRSLAHDRLGIVVDAFYGEEDVVGTPIIIYTVLLSPDAVHFSIYPSDESPYLLSNEYEYDIIAYLMIGPAKVPPLKQSMTGELFL